MLTSPVKNFNDFFKNRPPLVIFLICLISLAICSFAFAFYVQNTEQIVNTDSLKNWRKLADFIQEKPLCSIKSYKEKHTFQVMEEFTSFITLNLTRFKNFTNVEAIYNVNDWHSNCPNRDKDEGLEDFNVKINFLVPKVHADEYKVCARIQGPQKIMPKFLTLDNCQPESRFGITMATLYSKSENNAKSCFDNELKLLIDTNSDDFTLFVSEIDRTNIYIHLMWCSYISVAFIIIILLYSIFHQHPNEMKTYYQ